MRKLSLVGVSAILLLVPQLGLAQGPAPAPEPQQPAPQVEPAPSARPSPGSGPGAGPEREAMPPRGARRGRGATGRRAECRAQARDKGLRGRAMQDAALICYQEARLDCLKKAVAAGIAPRERREHIADCLGEEPRQRRGDRDER